MSEKYDASNVLVRSDDRINVLLLTSGLTYGGAERQVIELANNLDRERFNVVVCSLSSRIPLAINLRADLFLIKKHRKYDISVIWRLRRMVSERKIAVIHSFMNDANIAARLCRGFRSSPVVFSSERNSYYEESFVRRVVEKVTRPFMNLMVSNSFAGKQFCIDSRKMLEEQVAVVHNGVDSQRFRQDSNAGTALRQELLLDGSDLLVGMVANYKSQKNHRIFLLMAAQLLAENADVHFLIVGNVLSDDPAEHTYCIEINNLSTSLGLTDKLKFLSGRDDMASIYNACDVTVLPSSREGTPNVMLESMACGTPVVASDVADNAYVLRDGIDGRIVALRDDESTAAEFCGAVKQLIADKRKRKEMGRSARKRVEAEFSLARLAEKTADIYISQLSV